MRLGTNVQHIVLPAVEAVDRLIFGDPWGMIADDPDGRLDLIRTALDRHLAACSAYACYAEHLGFVLDTLREPADLVRVPQIPTLAFKRTAIMSCDERDIDKRCTSSGTLGRRSAVYRDRTTIERLLGSVERGMELVGDWHEDEVAIANLGPGQVEAGDLWFAYVMSLVELRFHTEHMVREGRFEAHDAALRVRTLLEEYFQVVVIGPPMLLLKLVAAVVPDFHPPAGNRLTVVTAGGWKGDTGALLNRQFFLDSMIDGLGLPGPEHVRDAFNLVELNTVIMECRIGCKHVPPWLEVIVRDPRTLGPVADGEVGLLSYLDPSATSYPCFILTDDLGTLRPGPCRCGRSGRLLTLHRRIRRAEEWGCALKMNRSYLERT
jgi:long-chain-fatty-acid---luciferin-component ligase